MNLIQKTGLISTAVMCTAGFYSCAGSTKNADENKTILNKIINYDDIKIKGMQDKAYAEVSININKQKQTDNADTKKISNVDSLSNYSNNIKAPTRFLNLIEDFIMNDCEDYLLEEKKEY